MGGGEGLAPTLPAGVLVGVRAEEGGRLLQGLMTIARHRGR